MPVQGYNPFYTASSPYRVTPITQNFMAYYVHRRIVPQENDILATMDQHVYVGRPDLLASDVYDDPDLWWVFGVRNGWEDPIHDLKLGIQVYIPQINYLRSIL